MSKPFDLQLSGVRVNLPNGKKLFAVDDLRIPYGSHILIQGESGKGKTTFLHLLAGLFLPNEGRVMIGTTDLCQLTEDKRCEFRRRNLGVIFQKLNLLEHLTVEENIELSRRYEKDFSTSEIMQAVKLEGRGHERCAHLSLGEQQRVAVARVLAQQPQILLADEPTSSLDEHNLHFVLESLVRASDGKTLIVVSHDHRIQKWFDKILQFTDYC